jgi:hypothetical protein
MEKPFRPTKKWWGAYQSLCGDITPQTNAKARGASLKPDHGAVLVSQPIIRTELQEQICLSGWLTAQQVPFYAVPNGGSRNWLEAVNLKRSGVQAGVPDLCIARARKGYHGLYIELKRVKGGKLSEQQCYWAKILKQEGYMWAEAKGFEAAKLIIEDYLHG